MTKTHLSLSERQTIELELNKSQSIRAIARTLGRAHTTIAREIGAHRLFVQTGAYGYAFNPCANRLNCTHQALCKGKSCHKKLCRHCKHCTKVCQDFLRESCTRLSESPYVCNGCEKKRKCTLEKVYYKAKTAHHDYRLTLTEAREGIHLSEDELLRLDALVSPCILNGQSPHHVYLTHQETMMCSPKTMYNYIDYQLFSCKNLDLPRKVSYRPRKKKKTALKIDKTCRVGRTLSDYQTFLAEHPGCLPAQMDTVIGRIGGKVLLTLYLPSVHFLFAFLLDDHTAKSVNDQMATFFSALGTTRARQLFPAILTDNGSEFSNPSRIERNEKNARITHLFYCDPCASYQKGALENAHEFIRRMLPKGTSFDALSQEKINLALSHINAYKRDSLGGHSPYEMFEMVYGKEILEKMAINRVKPHNVCLLPSLLK